MSKIDFSLMITAEEKAKADRIEQARESIATAAAVLAETDWMVIREAEGGAAMPDEIRRSRQDARELISKLRKGLK